MIKINSIKLNNFRFFTDENSSFEVNGKNVLIYGENGSGKSSIYKAFQFLAKPEISKFEFDESRNIFVEDGETYLEFDFSNGETLRIDEDHLSLDGAYIFIEKLSVSKPILDYKSLLNITYSQNYQNIQNEKKNLFLFFETLLENYPIESNQRLKDIKQSGEKYFTKFKTILKDEIFHDINYFLTFFNHNIKITDIHFDAFNKETTLDIEIFDKTVEKYHLFLNEARLSALAISIYFSIIKKLFSYLENESLKILVLDDLLISLDMNNRLHLVDILKSEFSDFQIFFFTHDKGLFEIFKDKMEWKAFEIYVDRHSDGYEVPFVKKNEEYSELAKQHFKNRDYPASANYLRKEVEKYFIKKLGIDKLDRLIDLAKKEDNYQKLEECFPKLTGALKSFEHCKNIQDSQKREDKCLEFANVVLKAVKTVEEIINENSFHDINGIKNRILNPQSHYDTSTVIYKKELEEAIKLIDKLLDE